MDVVTELEACANDLVAAARRLGDFHRRMQSDRPWATNLDDASVSIVPRSAPPEVHQARRTVLSKAASVQRLLAEPAGMMQHVAIQVGSLARSASVPMDRTY